MALLTLSLEIDELLHLDKKLQAAAEKALKDAARDLQAATLAHIKEQAQRTLHSTRHIYMEALSTEELDGGTVYVINLDMKKAGWIEEGLKPHSMVTDLLASKKISSSGQPWVKTAKDGSKYAAVPFQHNKGKTMQTPTATDLTDAIKSEMKKRKIPYAKIEMDETGMPKLGKLHKFTAPTPHKTREGPGMGQGPLYAPRQGHTGKTYLQDVTVTQRMKGNKVVRSITTFRTVSSKYPNKWFHPGLASLHAMDDGADWAQTQWEESIKPKILQSIVDQL